MYQLYFNLYSDVATVIWTNINYPFVVLFILIFFFLVCERLKAQKSPGSCLTHQEKNNICVVICKIN